METVLNKINVDTTTQPMFFGKDLSLQRYDRFKYPIFFDLFKKQFELIWRPEEIELKKDRNDFKTLTEQEQFIFTSNLKFQTMMDSVIARGIPVLLEYITLPELEACCKIWEFFETVHSYSYTYIIQNVYSEPSVVLDSILEDKEIIQRASTVARDYDSLKNCGDDKRGRLFLTLIGINILESLRFYVSFACAFGFANNGKMIGNADIIKLIKRDETLHVAITHNIIKIMRNEKDEGFQDTIKEYTPDAIQMFEEAVDEEKTWAKYLFKDGGMLGLNDKIMGQYIEWLADTRMSSLGFDKVYHTKNPIGGWLNDWLSSDGVQVAPQEKEITQYKIGASENDINSADFGEL